RIASGVLCLRASDTKPGSPSQVRGKQKKALQLSTLRDRRSFPGIDSRNVETSFQSRPRAARCVGAKRTSSSRLTMSHRPRDRRIRRENDPEAKSSFLTETKYSTDGSLRELAADG